MEQYQRVSSNSRNLFSIGDGENNLANRGHKKKNSQTVFDITNYSRIEKVVNETRVKPSRRNVVLRSDPSGVLLASVRQPWLNDSINPTVAELNSSNLTLLKHSHSGRKEDERAMDQFLELIASKMSLREEQLEPVSFFLLKQLTQRISSEYLPRFTSCVPKLIREDLRAIAPLSPSEAGIRNLERQILSKYGISGVSLRNLLRSFWRGLRLAMGKQEASMLFEALPWDMQRAFEAQPRKWMGLPPPPVINRFASSEFHGRSESQKIDI
jgi:hypothetical protein